MELELAAFERAAELALEIEPFLDRAIQLLGEELEVVAALLFRAIHRRIGMLQQRRGVAAVVGIERNPDAAGDLEIALPVTQRRRDRRQ